MTDNGCVTSVVNTLVLLGALVLPAASCAADGTAIFVMRPDGSDLRQVVRVPNFLEHSAPRFSHDGKRLLFAVAADDMASLLERMFYVVNVDGTGLKARKRRHDARLVA